MSLRNRVCSVLLGLLLTAAVGASTATAAPTIAGEFPLGSTLESSNHLVAGPEGDIWVTLAGPEKDVARIAPSGQVTEYDLGLNGASGITVGPLGKIWVTAGGTLTSFETGEGPAGPEATKQTTVNAEISGSYPLVLGPDGMLWVATSGTTLKVNPANPAEVEKFPKLGMSPRDIDVSGPNLVIADFAETRILTLTTAGEYEGERTINGGPQGVAGSASGLTAYSQPSVDPKKVGTFGGGQMGKELSLETGADPFGVDLGPDGAFWFASSTLTENNLLRLTTGDQLTELKGLKEGTPRQIATGPNHTLWVTLEKPGQPGFVAEVKGVEATSGTGPPPPGTEPRTQLGQGPKALRTRAKRATASFRFSSPDAGSSFQCRLVHVASRAKAPAFGACRSPRVYHLAAGSYRFEVRAVLGGLLDASPAARGFRVIRVARHRR